MVVALTIDKRKLKMVRRSNRVVILTLFGLFFIAPAANSFELPNHDPWFYQSTEQGYLFMIPDKAQHAWGSMLLNNTFKELNLPAEKISAPLLSFAAGFFYEVYQENQGLGFSQRDLVSDVAGILASELTGDSTVMYISYESSTKIIMVNFSIILR